METLPGEHNTDRATEPDNALNLAAVPGLESQRTELQDELAPGSSRGIAAIYRSETDSLELFTDQM